MEAQGRLLHEARALVGRSEIRDAIRLLMRLITAYPDSALLMDARWLLARCYEQVGSSAQALEQYDVLARVSGTPYTEEAVRRMTALRSVARGPAPGRRAAGRGITALLLNAMAIPSAPRLDLWLEQLATAGVSVVMIQIASSEGVYFQTALAPVAHDTVGTLTAVAHRHGILVYAATSIDRMEWIAPDLGWHDLRFDRVRGRLAPSDHLDLFNPAFQEYLSVFVGELARTGIDGILFRSAPARLEDGFTSFATDRFTQDFQTTLNPARLLPVGRSPGESGNGGAGERGARDLAQAETNSPGIAEPPPAFWQWVGWKAQARAKLLERLIAAARRSAPAVQVVIEVHQESVTEPVKALAQYGEDLLAIKQTFPDVLLFRAEAGRQEPSRSPVRADLTESFLRRVGDLLGGIDRVWLARGSMPARTPGGGLPNPSGDRNGLPAQIGAVYDDLMAEPFPLP